jgi:hypothetical protein
MDSMATPTTVNTLATPPYTNSTASPPQNTHDGSQGMEYDAPSVQTDLRQRCRGKLEHVSDQQKKKRSGDPRRHILRSSEKALPSILLLSHLLQQAMSYAHAMTRLATAISSTR